MADTYAIALRGRSILEIISEADIIVQIVSLILLFASVWSWAIIINQLTYFRRVRKKHKRLQKLLLSTHTLNDIFEAIKSDISAPAEYIFYKVFSELKLHTPEHIEKYSEERKDKIQSVVEDLAAHEKDKFVGEWENDLGYLATISSASPFIGLFGTVWGIMRSFQAIAFAKNTSLSVVAPGIAEALFATALGLIAAIPALIFYNILLNKVGSMERGMNDLIVKMSMKTKSTLKL